MQTQTIITLSNCDLANVNHLLQAWNLVGGARDGAKKEAKNNRPRDLSRDALEAKLFGKIGANQFTFEDITTAVAIIRRRRDELLELCDGGQVFTDPKLHEVWANGVRANANHAVRMAEDFVENLREDLMEHAAA